MKEEKFFDITFSLVNSNEKKNLITQFKGIEINDKKEIPVGEKLYKLNDGRMICVLS